jgi:putative heme iron utilization protein
MAADPLTPAVSDRICKHMNDDHAAAVLSYARHYGGITTARQARMLAVGPEAMRLEVDGTPVDVPFDHTLSDSEDAHRTLVAMLRSMPAPGNP